MKPNEIFENLVEPLRKELTADQWEFLLSRGRKYTHQLSGLAFTAGMERSNYVAWYENCEMGGYNATELADVALNERPDLKKWQEINEIAEP